MPCMPSHSCHGLDVVLPEDDSVLSSMRLMQEDFEMAVAKVMKKDSDKNMSLRKLFK